ncbi:hypothetical protein V6N12_076517 [Hibiscus sabdariffa]|uniref:RNase H type-1 domain-containing protein n=1 Tax=Hibiscus sabdariffa TaxID=183260 RepID=A0ABR2DA15_9ROSI
MKLAWSPEAASKAYIDTVKLCELYHDTGVAELVSAMAAGWNARFIVETWSHGGATATSIGLAALELAGMSPEVIVGEPEDLMSRLNGIDFMVVDSQRKDFYRVFQLANLSNKGAVMVCKNANSIRDLSFSWRNIVDDGPRQLIHSMFLPVGKGLDIAHVATSGGNSVVLIAELWVIHDSLLQAWVSGCSRVELESDCLETISIINLLSTALDGSALVSSIKDLIAREWDVVAHHVDWGNNRVADTLASWGRGLGVAQMPYSVPPADIVSLVEEEMPGSTSAVGELLVLDEAPILGYLVMVGLVVAR